MSIPILDRFSLNETGRRFVSWEKYLSFFKISLQKALEYKARLFIWLFWDILPPLIMLFFWLAVFKTRNQVVGYDFWAMVIYYFVVIFARNLVLTHPDETFQREVYSGEINVYLPRPANLIILKFFYEIAYKVLKIFYLIPVFFFCYLFFLKGRLANQIFELNNIFFFFLSCSISFCLYYFIKILIGITSFWFGEIEWLTGLEELALLFFGGTLFPLDFLPKPMQTIAGFLPFKYLFYLPAQGLLGKLSVEQMITSLLIQLFWTFLFLIILRKTYQAGLKIYSAFGG